MGGNIVINIGRFIKKKKKKAKMANTAPDNVETDERRETSLMIKFQTKQEIFSGQTVLLE